MTYPEWKDSILKKFQVKKPIPNGFQAICPAHDDQQASLSISFTEDKVLFACHAGCSFQQICTEAGLSKTDPFFTPPAAPRKIVKTYTYTDEFGHVLFQTVRYEPKGFCQRHKDSQGKWIWNMKGVRRVLYNLPAVMNAQTVLVVAGEKDCDTGTRLGFTCTTNPMGEGPRKWKNHYSKALHNKDVILIGDHDSTGQQHLREQAQSLRSEVRSLKIIEMLPGVPDHGDLTDWVHLDPEHHTQQALQALIDHTPEWTDVSTLATTDKDTDVSGEFWYMAEVRKGVFVPKLDRKKFLAWLENAGFGIIRIDNRLKFVRVRENVVSECLTDHGQVIDIKRFTIEYCRQHHFTDVENMLLTGHTHYFSLASLNTLQFFDLEFCRDTQDSAFLFFKNYVVEVTRQGVQVKPYAQLHGYLWENQILAYEYHGRYTTDPSKMHFPEGEFFEFFNRITAQDITEDRNTFTTNCQKIEAFISAYGYLLYGWKDCTEAKAVICVDNSLGDIDDDGRTGKSLLCESLKHLKNVNTEAGKTWDPRDRFAFQNVDMDTQIIFVDDITRKFPFKAVYPPITGDMSCEGKNQKKMVLPFAIAPKFVLTSNTPVKGEGDSDLARQCVLPFSRFFNLHITPKDIFGHRLFEDWNDSDWNEFFDFAIFCLHFHLTHGLLTYVDTAFEEAKLLMQVPEQVIQICQGLERDVNHDKTALFETLKEDGLKTTQHRLTKWLKIFCKYWKGTADDPETLRYKDDVIKANGKSKRAFRFEKA